MIIWAQYLDSNLVPPPHRNSSQVPPLDRKKPCIFNHCITCAHYQVGEMARIQTQLAPDKLCSAHANSKIQPVRLRLGWIPSRFHRIPLQPNAHSLLTCKTVCIRHGRAKKSWPPIMSGCAFTTPTLVSTTIGQIISALKKGKSRFA